jgi:Na+/H+ antiporter NhaD/arsenite permease-like protein
MQYYFSTGALSAFLDNAPTYLSFLAAAMGAQGMSVDSVADVLKFTNENGLFVMAVSLGAVFFGAGSYIGNGPNFMVKAIAEQSGVKMPSFFGYCVYSVGVLLPVFILVSVLFM